MDHINLIENSKLFTRAYRLSEQQARERLAFLPNYNQPVRDMAVDAGIVTCVLRGAANLPWPRAAWFGVTGTLWLFAIHNHVNMEAERYKRAGNAWNSIRADAAVGYGCPSFMADDGSNLLNVYPRPWRGR